VTDPLAAPSSKEMRGSEHIAALGLLLALLAGGCEECPELLAFATRSEIDAIAFGGDEVVVAMTRWEGLDGGMATRRDQVALIDPGGTLEELVDVGEPVPVQLFAPIPFEKSLSAGGGSVLMTRIGAGELTGTLLVSGRPAGPPVSIAAELDGFASFHWGVGFDGDVYQVAWMETDGDLARLRVRALSEDGDLGPVIEPGVAVDLGRFIPPFLPIVEVHPTGDGGVVVAIAEYQGPVHLVSMTGEAGPAPQLTAIPPALAWDPQCFPFLRIAFLAGELLIFQCGPDDLSLLRVDPSDLDRGPEVVALGADPGALDRDELRHLRPIGRGEDFQILASPFHPRAWRLFPDLGLAEFGHPREAIGLDKLSGTGPWAAASGLPRGEELVTGIVVFDGEDTGATVEVARGQEPFTRRDCSGSR
jgi:hypothetical protein